LRAKIRDENQAAVNIAGFSTPIRPIMILAPILLLLLYHDFALIMLYRKDLENKMISQKVDVWRSGPDTVGHYMLGFIPYKFRYVKWLWGVIQIVILFLPIIPAIYFCIYSMHEYKIKEVVAFINGICCVLILIDFLIMVDSENILGMRDSSMVFSGKKPSQPSSRLFQRRGRLALFIPLFVGTFTMVAFYPLLKNNAPALIACIACSLLTAGSMSVFSFLNSNPNIKRGKVLFNALAGGGFFASLFWFVIDLLACFGAIQFRILSPWSYVICSLILFASFSYVKIFYIVAYSIEKEQIIERERDNKT
jgi:hypothetical protein